MTKYILAALTMLTAQSNLGALVFTDDFSSAASAQWGDEAGSWYVTASGAYDSTYPNNSPCTYSSLPYDLTDFTISLSVNDVTDGGVWLRSTDNDNGILLVTRGTGIYFHEVSGGSFSGKLSEIDGLFAQGDDITLTIAVTGNEYKAYVNGSASAAVTFTSSLYASGKVALYDYSAQTFDNVTLTSVPEPASCAALGGLGALVLAFAGRLRRKIS
jgi:hypothetical protein